MLMTCTDASMMPGKINHPTMVETLIIKTLQGKIICLSV